MARYESKYGVRETGKPCRFTDGYGISWHRKDTWCSNDPKGEKDIVETAHCAGPDDDSNVVSIGIGYEGSVYDSRCSCCYLHINHTRNVHDRSCSSWCTTVTS